MSQERKRKAEEAGVAVIDLTGDSPPPKRQRPSATPKRTRKYNLSDTESDERNGIRPVKSNRHATKSTISQGPNSTEKQPESITKHAGKERSKDADKSAQPHAAEDAGEKPKKKKKTMNCKFFVHQDYADVKYVYNKETFTVCLCDYMLYCLCTAIIVLLFVK